MDQGEGYFQFSLCLLCLCENVKDRLQHIVSYCVCEQARRANPAFPNRARKNSLDQAASFLRVEIECHQNTIHQWKKACGFIRNWENRHGRDALVRIGARLLWEAHNNTGVSYREFSVLCAINSIIGSRATPIRITQPSIRVRAGGFKSWDIAKSELPYDQLREAKLLTEDQLRRTLDKLHCRGFFARARVGAKTVKYMLGVNDTRLRAILLQRESYPAQFRISRAKKDAELRAAIKSVKQQTINVGKHEIEGISVLTQPPTL